MLGVRARSVADGGARGGIENRNHYIVFHLRAHIPRATTEMQQLPVSLNALQRVDLPQHWIVPFLSFFPRTRLRGELRKDQDSLAEEDTTENAMSTRNENRKAEQVSRGRSLQLKPSTQHQ